MSRYGRSTLRTVIDAFTARLRIPEEVSKVSRVKLNVRSEERVCKLPSYTFSFFSSYVTGASPILNGEKVSTPMR